MRKFKNPNGPAAEFPVTPELLQLLGQITIFIGLIVSGIGGLGGLRFGRRAAAGAHLGIKTARGNEDRWWIFIGIFLTALGGLGAFVFGEQITMRKDAAAAKTEEQLRTQLTRLEEGNTALRTQLAPFADLATQMHPTLRQDEALSRLRNDLDQLRAETRELDRRVGPREVPGAQRSSIVAALRRTAPKEVMVDAALGDREAVVFAEHLIAIMAEAGWKATMGAEVGGAQPLEGLMISVPAPGGVRDAAAERVALDLLAALRSGGLDAKLNADRSLNPGGPARLVVGHKER